MKSLLPAMLIGFLMFGYGEGTAQIQGKQSSVVAEVDDVVGGVMDNYSSIESGFAEAENALRSSDAPVIKILDDLTKIVSGERAESEGMKHQLLTLKKKLEDRKKKIDLAAGKASPSMRESYGLALSEIEGKLDGKIKPLLDFDFQYLDKFEKDLSAATLEWKEFLGNVNGVLDEGLIRNELANRISDHFEENMAKPIEERRSKWGSVVKARKERVQKEQIDGRPPFVDNLPKPTEQRSPQPINANQDYYNHLKKVLENPLISDMWSYQLFEYTPLKTNSPGIYETNSKPLMQLFSYGVVAEEKSQKNFDSLGQPIANPSVMVTQTGFFHWNGKKEGRMFESTHFNGGIKGLRLDNPQLSATSVFAKRLMSESLNHQTGTLAIPLAALVDKIHLDESIDSELKAYLHMEIVSMIKAKGDTALPDHLKILQYFDKIDDGLKLRLSPSLWIDVRRRRAGER